MDLYFIAVASSFANCESGAATIGSSWYPPVKIELNGGMRVGLRPNERDNDV